jgi:hypothetical protein
VAATVVAMVAFFSIPAMADGNNVPVEVKGLKNGYNGSGG